jgi:hypothetical protein
MKTTMKSRFIKLLLLGNCVVYLPVAFAGTAPYNGRTYACSSACNTGCGAVFYTPASNTCFSPPNGGGSGCITRKAPVYEFISNGYCSSTIWGCTCIITSSGSHYLGNVSYQYPGNGEIIAMDESAQQT